jgi:hypothetical protein
MQRFPFTWFEPAPTVPSRELVFAGRWMADAFIHATVIARLTETHCEDKEFAEGLRTALLAHARALVVALQGDTPAATEANVLIFKKASK